MSDVTHLLPAIDAGQPQAAEALEISSATAKRHWAYVVNESYFSPPGEF